MKPLILAALGLAALAGCWWAGRHGQDQVSVAFGLIGGTLLAAAGYAWTGRHRNIRFSDTIPLPLPKGQPCILRPDHPWL